MPARVGYFSGDGKTHKLAAFVRRAAVVVTGLRNFEEQCTGGRPLSFGARPLCDV